MAINAIKYETTVEAQIRATSMEEVSADMAEITRVKKKDRTFNPDKKVWVIAHADEYTDIPFVKRAFMEAERYPTLFEAASLGPGRISR